MFGFYNNVMESGTFFDEPIFLQCLTDFTNVLDTKWPKKYEIRFDEHNYMIKKEIIPDMFRYYEKILNLLNDD